MNAPSIEAAQHSAFAATADLITALPTRRSTLARSSPASRGEGSWLAALMIALALLVLWASLRMT